ncbi:type II restriction-modification system endonuclease [Prolixibacter bellariivorans]|uniref:Type II restriction-modification system endonuclease n=1 Tax=Prolixibacter bellariivorans TaxID=314319 RepID=A0A5M4B111_9BACT|nr:Eco29kI family restriction endonuclease [Prolixibacter bellariivorans]GET33845.1 type II restriction-modification system endonuclease [Prolixibacter bellariivorans]
MNRDFKREEHVYSSEAFEEIIKDTIRFFNGTPVIKLPPPEKFHGTGVYAIYFIGKSKLYSKLAAQNRIEFSMPIYVGKAVPRGWRQARIETQSSKKSYELNGRLNEHGRSIEQVNNLSIEDFYCRFIILENAASSLISTVEAALIRYYKPIWNTQIDGFGNHDPGKGRYNQAKSEWDVLHPGRPWADKCLGDAPNFDKVEEKAIEYYSKKKS